MKCLFFGLAALPFLAGVASSTERLSDAQMDRITAGDAGCTISFGGACIITVPGASSGPVFVPTSPTTVISDLFKLFGVGVNPSVDTSADVFTIPIPR